VVWDVVNQLPKKSIEKRIDIALGFVRHSVFGAALVWMGDV
jgi:hypothetical protein